ncbi:hypothetical protein GCM10027057_16250 [Marisediminicola antarctica]|uniref:Uncharacterized protein n=1 Tax=Marisediminicola antarctica TaxID=674079 RepID=A0A7L5AHH5_9MICO|nr:hypothetical protein BHD05_05620 [Marisediminicola antarctica]
MRLPPDRCGSLVIVVVTMLSWRDELPSGIVLRNDVGLAPTVPTWLMFVGLVAVLLGVGIGALSLVPEGPNDARSRRVPLFWCGAVAGCAATIFAGLYGLVPFFVASRPLRD